MKLSSFRGHTLQYYENQQLIRLESGLEACLFDVIFSCGVEAESMLGKIQSGRN